jgi:hypothetical protein
MADLPYSQSRPAYQRHFKKRFSISLIPSLAPHVPGNTEAERRDAAVRKVFTASKDELLKEEARQKKGAREIGQEISLSKWPWWIAANVTS